MIGEVFTVLRDQLNDHLAARSGATPLETSEPVVVLSDGDSIDQVGLKLNAVSALLVNIEEVTATRSPDRFRRTMADGTVAQVAPDIQLNVYVLFAARYKDYEQGLTMLSSVIGYFQANRVLDHTNAPGLSDRIEKLQLELVTLSFSEQSEIWGALRTPYHPSTLYRVRMVTVAGDAPIAGPEIVEIVSTVSQ